MADADLAPTKTRVALLAAVKRGEVHRDEEVGLEYRLFPSGEVRRVTAEMHDLETAGWVDREDRWTWFVTEAGQHILDAFEDPA